MSTHYNHRLLMVKTNSELAEIYQASVLGLDTGFSPDDVSKEIAYRELIDEWCTQPSSTKNYE